MAVRLSELANRKGNNKTFKPTLFKLVTGNNGRTIYVATIEKMATVEKGPHKGKTLVLFTGEEYDGDNHVMVKREMKAFLDEDTEKLPIKEGHKVVLCYAPAKDTSKPGIIEEVAYPGQCMSITTEHDGKEYKKVIVYGIVKRAKWNDKRNVFTISFMDLQTTTGKDYGQASKWEHNGDEYLAFWTNVAFFGPTGNEKHPNRYPADRAEQDIHVGDEVVVLTQFRQSVDQNTGFTYVNHNANKYMVTLSKQTEETQNQSNEAPNQSNETANPTNNSVSSGQQQASQNTVSQQAGNAASQQANRTATQQTGNTASQQANRAVSQQAGSTANQRANNTVSQQVNSNASRGESDGAFVVDVTDMSDTVPDDELPF